jgi:hypothetical protein
MKRSIVTAVVLLAVLSSVSVTAQLQYYVTANANLYIPEGSKSFGTYPILWYDKETDPKFLIGGFGAGFALEKEETKAVILRVEANISRHTYWQRLTLRDPSNQPLGNLAYGSVDYGMHLIPSVHYRLGNKLSIGSGLTVNALFYSYSRVPDEGLGGPDSDRKLVKNEFYKPITLMIPLELSVRTARKMYSIRFEQALGSRYKKDLAPFLKDHYGILSFSIGWKLDKKETN